MKQKKEKTLKEPKVKKQGKGREFLVFIIIAFAMVFLTSSFIVEDAYNYASRLSMTPDGVKEVYEASIGKRTFAEENNNPTTTVTPTPTPTTTVAPTPTPEATPEPTTPTATPASTAGQ
ncbi:MAG: hypothetical protein RR614_07625 [Eubacterium sp.]